MRRKYLTQEKKDKIVRLLRDNDLTMKVIAQSVYCDETLVSDINREYGEIRKTPRRTREKKPFSQTRFTVLDRDIKKGFL